MGFVTPASIDELLLLGVRKVSFFGGHRAQKEDANPELLQIHPKANGGFKKKKRKRKSLFSFFFPLNFRDLPPPHVSPRSVFLFYRIEKGARRLFFLHNTRNIDIRIPLALCTESDLLHVCLYLGSSLYLITTRLRTPPTAPSSPHPFALNFFFFFFFFFFFSDRIQRERKKKVAYMSQ